MEFSVPFFGLGPVWKQIRDSFAESVTTFAACPFGVARTPGRSLRRTWVPPRSSAGPGFGWLLKGRRCVGKNKGPDAQHAAGE